MSQGLQYVTVMTHCEKTCPVNEGRHEERGSGFTAQCGTQEKPSGAPDVQEAGLSDLPWLGFLPSDFAYQNARECCCH